MAGELDRMRDRGTSGDGPGAPAPGIEPRASRAAALALIALGALLRSLYVLHHPVCTDEPQHLHVAWGWTQGLLPYRDVFDNHSPLFSMMMAPLLALVGERADVVVVMRLAMIPFVAAAMAATWVIARRLFGATTAWWAVAMAAVFPEYLRASVEYRSDQPWSALWLWSLAALVGGPLGVARCFVTGLLVGAALSTSMKALAAGAGLATALVAVALVSSWRRPLRWIAPRLASAAAGGVLVPALLLAYFASRGAFPAMRLQMTSYNTFPGLGLWSSAPWRAWLFVPCVLAFAWLAARQVLGAPERATGRRRGVVLLACGFYWASVETLWPLVTHQDYLPVFPIAALALAVLALALGGRVVSLARGAAMRRAAAIAAPTAVVLLLVVVVIRLEPPWRDGTVAHRTLLGDVLRLTRPGEFVMDREGESIFRPRPTRLVLEEVTVDRIMTGRLADDIEARMVATATPVALSDFGRIPGRVREFIAANYLQVGWWWMVAGLKLAPADSPGGPRAIRLRVAGRYAALTARGPARGALDGTPISASRVLAAGAHEYRPAPGEETVFLVWADAVERGFLPVELWAGRR